MDKPKNFIKNKYSKNILAYGFPHRGRGFEQRARQKKFKKIV